MALATCLIVIGGLPGTGKTSLARGLAEAIDAVHVRVDSIEQAIREATGMPESIETAGYLVAYAVAADNLHLGRTVVADCVNPLPITRAAWHNVARTNGVPIIEVEVICSDAAEHRRRVESRVGDIPGLALPTWEEIVQREYATWDRERAVIDTARRTVEQCVTAVYALLLRRGR